jgi:UDP-glucose 4-epimerase
MTGQKHILVTGGAGFIGSHAVRALVLKGYRVTVLDNLSKGHRQAVHPQARLVEMDLAEIERLKEFFVKEKFDAVMHFAGLVEVGLSMKEPEIFFRTNLLYGVHLLEAMRVSGVKHLIFSSTAAVYGSPKVIPIKEDAELAPTNFYGQSKLFFENVLRKYDDFYGFRFAALRYFNAAGADPSGEIGQDYEPSTHIVPRVLQYAQGKIKDFKIYGGDFPTLDGTCIRDYIHVNDLVDAHLLALEYLFGGGASDVFNLGNGRGFSVKEVIETARRVTGLPLPVEIGPRREGDPAVLVADSTKARKILKWNPKLFKLEDIVETAWKWHKSHPDGYGP